MNFPIRESFYKLVLSNWIILDKWKINDRNVTKHDQGCFSNPLYNAFTCKINQLYNAFTCKINQLYL